MVTFIRENIIRTPWISGSEIPILEQCAKIHHYTSEGGFEGIITNETLRFTNVKCLNDTAEIKDGFDEVLRYREKDKYCNFNRNLITVKKTKR